MTFFAKCFLTPTVLDVKLNGETEHAEEEAVEV
jgi:hypothetical protein